MDAVATANPSTTLRLSAMPASDASVQCAAHRPSPHSKEGLELSKSLLRAAIVDETESVRSLITKGAPVTAEDCKGETALHWLARHNRPKEIEMAVSAGADVNQRSSLATTPLKLAIDFNHSHCARILRKAGASVESRR